MQRRSVITLMAASMASLALAGCSTTRAPSALDPVVEGSVSIQADADAIFNDILTKVLPLNESTSVYARTADGVIVNYGRVMRAVLDTLPTRDLMQGADLVTQTRIEFKLSGANPTLVEWRSYTAEILADDQERRIYFTGIDFRFVQLRLESGKRRLETTTR